MGAHRDVIVALLEASASLSGLLLVFLGFVVNTYTSMGSETPVKVRRSLERAAIGLLAALVVGLSCVALAAIWLTAEAGNAALFAATGWLFGAQLAGLAGATAWAMKTMLSRHRQRTATRTS